MHNDQRLMYQERVVNWMKRLGLKLFLLLIVIATLLIFVIFSFEFNRMLDDPATCNTCHEMKDYVSTYLEPKNGSIIAKHELSCLGCHTNTSIEKGKAAILKEIKIGIINRAAGVELDINSSDLRANCLRCHLKNDFRHFNITEIAQCHECHWSHKPPADRINPYLIPYGPHRNQTCDKCHGMDFRIPNCMDCHTGHGKQKLENSLCLACHVDPHVPVKPGISRGNTVNFTSDLPFSLCEPCHEKQLEELRSSNSGHFSMGTCTKCHDSHGKKYYCSKCHPNRITHGHQILICNDCHGKITGMKCTSCHGSTHEWSAYTALVPDDLD